MTLQIMVYKDRFREEQMNDAEYHKPQQRAKEAKEVKVVVDEDKVFEARATGQKEIKVKMICYTSPRKCKCIMLVSRTLIKMSKDTRLNSYFFTYTVTHITTI